MLKYYMVISQLGFYNIVLSIKNYNVSLCTVSDNHFIVRTNLKKKSIRYEEITITCLNNLHLWL